MKLSEFIENLGYEIRKIQYLASILYYSDDIDRNTYTEEQHSWLDVSFWNLIWDCGKLYGRDYNSTSDVYSKVFNVKQDVPKFKTYKGCIDELKRTCKKGQAVCKSYMKDHTDIISPTGIKQGVEVEKLGLACSLKEFLYDLDDMYNELNPNRVIKTILLGQLPENDINIKKDIYDIINTEKDIFNVFNSKKNKNLGKNSNEELLREIKSLSYRDGGYGGKLELKYITTAIIDNVSKEKINKDNPFYSWRVITPKLLKEIEKEAAKSDDSRFGFPVERIEGGALLLVDCKYTDVYEALAKGLAKKYNVKDWKKIYKSIDKVEFGPSVKFSKLAKEEQKELKEKGAW